VILLRLGQHVQAKAFGASSAVAGALQVCCSVACGKIADNATEKLGFAAG